ncbi:MULTISPECIES: hypothetical protein [Rhizobium]|uniref:hypothetical protein n=1 Tax=Rhizobium TaxID=379 RepID=UPI001EF8BE1B|nr:MULTISPECIES: hypothetical protein [Rhizobium]ULJ72359.1 hypothetical protein L2W42_01060 [Rhizobium gallicum]WFU86319.1 hypothetical protein QA644_14395 [Rhizobium sp. CC1099]
MKSDTLTTTPKEPRSPDMAPQLDEKSKAVIADLERRITKVETKLRDVRDLRLDIGVSEMARELCGYLSPKDPVGLSFERVGRDYDGGYVMVSHFPENRICYSIGINRDVSWDSDMAAKGYDVFQYDHTIEGLPTTHPNFHFARRGITGPSLSGGDLSSLPEEIKKNGHCNEGNMILKVDIEGHEWDVFSEMTPVELNQFSQILVECHSLYKLHKLFWFRKARQALLNLSQTHQAVHIHGNNNSAMHVLGGIAVPQTLEVTYLRRDVCRFEPCSRNFPTELDQPNNPNFAQHSLGNFQFP